MEIKIDRVEKVTFNNIAFQTGDILEIETKSNNFIFGRFLKVCCVPEKDGIPSELIIQLDSSCEYCSDVKVVTLDKDTVSIRVLGRND